MKVWVILSQGIAGSQVDGVMPDSASAATLLTNETSIAVEMEIGRDYRDVSKFVVMTAAKPRPTLVDFGQSILNRPKV